jgi:hypothetical protein
MSFSDMLILAVKRYSDLCLFHLSHNYFDNDMEIGFDP